MPAQIAPGSIVVHHDGADSATGVVLGTLDDGVHLLVAAAAWESAPGAASMSSDDLASVPEGAVPPLWVRGQETVALAYGALELVGALTDEATARVLRERTVGSARLFHDAWHLPRRPQESTDVVAYAGRVFDHREVENAVEASLDFWLTMGRYADRLQRDLSAYLGVRRAYLVGSGSAANLVAMSALTSPALGERALRPGDEVITTACAFPTTVNPILQNGCVAVLVDTDPGSGNVDVAAMEAALTDRTRAVILAHALGNPFDLARVSAFCRAHGLWVVEDTCDALGSLYEGKPVGSFGDLSTLSFYPAHHITTGEGGAVNVVSDTSLMRVVESVRDWGRDCWCKSGQDNVCGSRFSLKQGDLPEGYDHKFVYSHVGYNLKPTDWQAAIGCAQFEKLEQFNAARRRNWAGLREVFADFEDVVELPYPEPGSDPSWFGFKVMVRADAPFDRADLVTHLEAERVQTRMIFAGNIARQPAYVGHPLVRTAGRLAGADRIMDSAFFIGVYPGNTDLHVERVAEAMRRFGKTAASDANALRLAARDLSPWRKAGRSRPVQERG
jgi:CDP-6-deoxy-D-xylo-4-hexulose-3-dehydrase